MLSSRAPRIAILEDNPDCRRLLQVTLRADYECVFCRSGDELLRIVGAAAADLVLLDIGLPGTNGMEIAREIRRSSQVPIIFVTAQGSHEEAALNLGGDDFINKPYSPMVLSGRIRSVLRRCEPKKDADQTGTVSYADLLLDPGLFAVVCGKTCGHACSAQLTKMEFDILSVLFRSKDRSATRDDIWRMISGRDWDRQNRNIDVHLAHIRHKLNAAFGVSDLIQTLRGVGYRLASDNWCCDKSPLQ